MAKLYFYYSAMNAGKTTILLQSAYNYRERGMDTLLFTPVLDTRYQRDRVTSRIGIDSQALSFDQDFNFFEYCQNALQSNPKLKCIFVDEAQFLLKDQVRQLTQVVDSLDIPVLCYGLRSDFKADPFEGSIHLLILADNIIEIKTICYCGKKAIMNTRIDALGKAIRTGEQIQIGGNDKYQSRCRKHFFQEEAP